jgi:SAM-dependent methyltransferase
MAAEIPAATEYPGAVPTLNGRGYMLEALDDYAQAFVEAAAAAQGEALDIGCAYGVATLAALAKGARVCAADMEPRHLEIVRERAAPADRTRLRTVIAMLPGADFPHESFDAILAARVLHFLNGAEYRTAMAKIATWLAPGGRLFITADSPYMPGWSAIVPEYESAKARAADWPGFMADFSKYTSRAGGGTHYLNSLDPDILARECGRVGLVVERAGFFPMARLGVQSSGREHCGIVARKPR